MAKLQINNTDIITESSGNITYASGTFNGTVGASATINADALPNKHNRCINRVTGTGFTASSMDPVDTTWTIENIGNSDEVMTESGGIFSFPSTGIWKVNAFSTAFNNSSTAYNMENCNFSPHFSTDSGASYTHAVAGQEYITFPANDWYRQSIHTEYIYDVTNKDTFRLKFKIYTNPNTTVYWGLGTTNGHIYFVKLGET